MGTLAIVRMGLGTLKLVFNAFLIVIPKNRGFKGNILRFSTWNNYKSSKN